MTYLFHIFPNIYYYINIMETEKHNWVTNLKWTDKILMYPLVYVPLPIVPLPKKGLCLSHIFTWEELNSK